MDRSDAEELELVLTNIDTLYITFNLSGIFGDNSEDLILNGKATRDFDSASSYIYFDTFGYLTAEYISNDYLQIIIHNNNVEVIFEGVFTIEGELTDLTYEDIVALDIDDNSAKLDDSTEVGDSSN